MKTTAREERILIISDIHMGNLLHTTRRPFTEFVRFALDNDYSVCVNGDGVDIAQLSLVRLYSDVTPSLGLFAKFGRTDRRIYYTVGNHDIVLEHFLTDIGRMIVVPFLNLYSGDKRIRVEHGHMYDTLFLKYPRSYFAFMAIGRLGIAVSPRFYDALHRLNGAVISFAEWLLSGFGRDKKEEAEPLREKIEGERDCFGEGAEDVGMRGFDAVVFGHTHLPGAVTLPGGLRYYNTGGWFTKPWCVAIDQGRIWFGTVADLVKNGDPFPAGGDREDEQDPYARPRTGGAAPVEALRP